MVTGGISSAARTGWQTAFSSMYGMATGPSSLTILAFGAFLAPLDKEFHWGVPAIAFGSAIISIMIMLLSPVQGFLVDRFGGRRVALTSIPFFGLSLCAMYFLPGDLRVFYAAWVVISICGVGVWPISYLRSTTGWFDRHLGLALGIANAGIGVGTMLVPLLAGYMIGAFGWRETYLALGLIGLTAWPVGYFFLRDPSPSASSLVAEGDTIGQAIRSRPFVLAVASFMFIGAFTSSLILHQVKIMIDAGIPPGTAAAIPAAFGLALLIGRLCTGWLLDRIKASKIMTALMVCGVGSALLFSDKPSMPVAVCAAVLLGFVTGSEFDVLAYIVPRYHGRRSFGKIYGWIFAAFQLTSAIGAVAVGKSREALGSYTPAMYTLAACCVAAAILFNLLGPYRNPAGGQAPSSSFT